MTMLDSRSVVTMLRGLLEGLERPRRLELGKSFNMLGLADHHRGSFRFPFRVGHF